MDKEMMKYFKKKIKSGLNFAKAAEKTAKKFEVHENIIWEELAEVFLNKDK